MIVKERKYKTCKCCNSTKLVKDEVHGCDGCQAILDFNSPEVAYLDMTIHRNDLEAETLIFCSWECAFDKLKDIKCDNFFSLPYLTFYEKNKKTGVEAFFKEISKNGKKKRKK